MLTSGDGTRFATVDAQGGILVWRTETLDVIFIAVPPDRTRSGDISSSNPPFIDLNSDGSLLVAEAAPGVVIWDVNKQDAAWHNRGDACGSVEVWE